MKGANTPLGMGGKERDIPKTGALLKKKKLSEGDSQTGEKV